MVTKLTLYYGKAKPLVITGAKACRLVSFGESSKGWHYASDADKPVLEKLRAKHGCIDFANGMWRFVYP